MKKFTFLSTILLCMAWMAYGQWTYTDLTSPKKFMGVTSLGSKAFFAGGGNGSSVLMLVESYDVETGNWKDVGNLSIARQAVSATSCGSKLFFGGGVNASMNTVYQTVDIYDTITGIWTIENLSVARFDISAVSHGDIVMFAGGCNYTITCTDAVDVYDNSSGTWNTMNLSTARAGMASAVVGDLAIFAGGFNTGGSVSNVVDIYNFTFGSWSTATLSEARVWASAAVVGNKVIIAGGIKNFPDMPSDVADIYDASDGTWSTATLFEPRAWISAGAVNGWAFFAGGSNVANGGIPHDFSDIIDVYNLADNSWSVDVLATPRTSQGVVAGDYFLVAGGTGESGLLSSVEVLYVPHVPHIIHVPGDYTTIQDGINAAENGDTVLVAEGTYYENINFLGKKPLLVASEFLMDGDTNHINNTIIDGSQPANPDVGSVVTFESGEDTTSVICGFTITGGTGTVEPSVSMRMGGGLHIKYSGGKFLNNHIRDNIVSYNGGVYGAGMELGAPISEIPWIVLRGNRIYNNEAISSSNYASGGGLICFYNLILENNEISNNKVNGYMGGDGGGMECMGAFGPIELKINHNIIVNNLSKTSAGSSDYAGLGAGMCFAFDCWGIISNNVISFNSIEAPDTYISWGPGAFIQDITLNNFIFENNLIEENMANTANCKGGGLSLLRAGGIYQNNVLRNNRATLGGGISIGYNNEVSANAILINNTITGNEASTGGGIQVQSSKSVIINTIVWGNAATNAPSIYQSGSNLEVRYSDIEGSEAWPGEGNILEEPQFEVDGYHLHEPGGLLNAGVVSIDINGVTYLCPPYDIDGDLRPYAETQPEIGVDEVQITGVNEPVSIINNPVKFYPNPADQRVTISIKKGTVIKEIGIFNQLGQLVLCEVPHGNTLDISMLEPGIYLVKVNCGSQIFNEKLIVE